MQMTRLGGTGLEISRLGFGAWAAGGAEWRQGWSGQDDRDSVAAIERAVELGMNWIDTAPAYGWGHSERIVGQALRGLARRPLLFTKCSAVRGDDGSVTFDLEPDSLRRELEGSLERLGTEAIDLYQIHRPLPERDLERAWETLASFKSQGLVRHVGVSNFTVSQLQRIGAISPVETIQPAYSLMQPEAASDLLPFAGEHGIGVIVYSPIGSGLLSGTMTPERFAALPANDWRKNDGRFGPDKRERSFELVRRLRRIGEPRGMSPATVAIAWALAHPAVDGAIVGLRNADQVDGIIRASELVLTDDELAALTA
jgi:aryl-alcohol dehydrogenase-like predicted oxidoreductase